MSREDEIRARLDAATPGPWEIKTDYLDTVTGEGGDPYISAPLMEVVVSGVWDDDTGNADLIAHAPDDLRWLLAEVDGLRRQQPFRVAEANRTRAEQAEAKVARVEALADEWGIEGPSLVRNAYDGRDVHEGMTLEKCAADLRDALRGDS